MQRAQIISRGVHKLAQTPWLSEAKKNGPFIYIIEQKKKIVTITEYEKTRLDPKCCNFNYQFASPKKKQK